VTVPVTAVMTVDHVKLTGNPQQNHCASDSEMTANITAESHENSQGAQAESAARDGGPIMFDTILGRFPAAKKSRSGYVATCPAHEDKHPSLSVTAKAGKVLLHCHAGCSVEAVCAAAGIEPRDLFLPEPKTAPRRRIAATYDYRDETGGLLFQSVRYEPKSFRYRRPDGAGGHGWNLAGARLVLYRLPELLGADRASPVFIVEGEKDVDSLCAIGVTATCSPMGALKWRDEYGEHLRGRHCVILPDNDDPGRRHAHLVAQSLLQHADQISILELPGLPDKGDVSDWLAAGNRREDLFALLSGAEIIDKEANGTDTTTTELPDRFFLTDAALYYRDKDDIFVSSAIRVVARTCDRDNGNWGRLVEFADAMGVEHSLIVPMCTLSGDAAEVRRLLMDAGLMIAAGVKPRQLFLDYLLRSDPSSHVTSVNQLGWHDGAFVFPDAVVSNYDESKKTIRLQNVDRAANKFRTAGTLEDWRNAIANYCVGNSRLMFAASVAFAAALLPIAEEPSGGFHIHGNSSTGKTTALLVAGSVWGGDDRKGFLETWRATSNGLEAVAELHNHSLLLLDEISQVNPHEVGEVIYALSNGFGKARMSKSIAARPKAEWNLTFLSSGEKTLEQVMHGVNQRLFGGQEARFVNIQADAGGGHGIFERLHGLASGSDMSKHFASASRKLYGTPIRSFLEHVCSDREIVISRIKEARQHFTAKLQHWKASGEVYRVASRFALVVAGGALASEFGITGWTANEVVACCERIFDEWLDLRGTAGSYDTAQGVRQVLAFLEQHGGSRFQSVTDAMTRIPNRAGFKRESFEGQTEYLILPEVFEREICRGFQHIGIAKELERFGHLRRGSEKNYLSSKESLPELGRRRVYVVTYEPRETDSGAISENEAPVKGDIGQVGH
jgi:putative DNA primase/helicase